jgi:hypothetical protein
MAAGLYQVRPPLPYVPCIELCGEVVGTGQRVLGAPSEGHGAFADFVLVDADRAWPVPEGMPDEKAAALYIPYQTGHVGLHRRAHLQAREWLLMMQVPNAAMFLIRSPADVDVRDDRDGDQAGGDEVDGGAERGPPPGVGDEPGAVLPEVFQVVAVGARSCGPGRIEPRPRSQEPAGPSPFRSVRSVAQRTVSALRG